MLSRAVWTRSGLAPIVASGPPGRGRNDAVAAAPLRVVRADAKRKKGPREDAPSAKSGDATKPAAKSGGGGGGGGGSSRGQAPRGGPPGKVRTDRDAYSQETRRTILTMEKVSKTTPQGKVLLKNISLSYYLGAKIGVLGANGAGKSTLLGVLSGEDEAIDGRIVKDDGVRVGYLKQEPTLDAGPTVRDNVEAGTARVRAMLSEFEVVAVDMANPDNSDEKTAELSARMEELQSRLDACNAWEIDRYVDRAMDALRVPDGDALVENLSGGERRRVALCALVLDDPDVLFLDEPTNHLDAESVAWLEGYLSRFRGTVVAVTHDRYFLDNVAGWILELDRGQGLPFEGNYTEWLDDREKRQNQEARERSALSRQLKEELEWSQKNAKGQQAKSGGKARESRIEDLQARAAAYIQASKVDEITVPLGPRLGNEVLRFEGVAKSFGDRLLYEGLNLDIPPGAVVGVVGPNGAGKSTLFDLALGNQQPDAGCIVLGETVLPMYVRQDRSVLDGCDKTVAEFIAGPAGADATIDLGGREVPCRQYLNWYNFRGTDVKKKVSMLSGGERNRLVLATVLKEAGNLLLLDEPTNDLDVDTLRALEGALTHFAGSAMVISHDRWFLDRVATHILAFEGNSEWVWHEGDYSSYAEDLRKRNGGRDPTRVRFRKLATMG